MEDPTYSVVLDGTIRDGQSVEQVVLNLAKLFQREEAKVRFLVAGKQVIIKKGCHKRRHRGTKRPLKRRELYAI